MPRRPLLQIILAMAVACFVGSLVVGVTSYPVAVSLGEGPPGTNLATGAVQIRCPGPLTDGRPSVDSTVSWPLEAACADSQRNRRVGTLLALALSACAGVAAGLLAWRDGPAPALDPPGGSRRSTPIELVGADVADEVLGPEGGRSRSSTSAW